MSVPLAYAFRNVPRRLLLSALLAVFVLSTVASAVAPTYTFLLGARVVVALSQSVFWAVIDPAAASLFSVAVRGRAAATVFGGSALAPMLGVPAGTWLGQQAGWQAAFWALAAMGLLAFAMLALLMPTRPVGVGHAASGTAPSVRRYWLLFAMTVVSVAGLFVAFTFTTPFLTDVSGFSDAAISPVLFLRGVVDLIGVFLGGVYVDRYPDIVMIGSIGLIAVSLVGMWAFGGSQVVTAGLLALSGFALGTISPAMTARVLEVAPGNSDIASAGTSAAFNLGIGGGALLGGIVLSTMDLPATALIGGLLVLAGLVMAIADPFLAAADRRRAVASSEEK
jgi:DHA1 family inner membrane transport protein